uniref:Uncharacterized protein n=1 Tax=Pipistrellus kuhlii TaxID=59472 RepID=A0A7J7ZJ54_PIPKU|nr:hypothetical protein mPipKuh1_009505 [Pipistrellus kuhlii]
MEPLGIKPMIQNLYLIPDLIAVSISPRDKILINQFGIFCSKPKRPSAKGPCLYPIKRNNLHDKTTTIPWLFSSPQRSPHLKITLSFHLLIAPYPASYSNLFCTTHLSIFLQWRWDAAQFINCFIKPIRFSNLLS